MEPRCCAEVGRAVEVLVRSSADSKGERWWKVSRAFRLGGGGTQSQAAMVQSEWEKLGGRAIKECNSWAMSARVSDP